MFGNSKTVNANDILSISRSVFIHQRILFGILFKFNSQFCRTKILSIVYAIFFRSSSVFLPSIHTHKIPFCKMNIVIFNKIANVNICSWRAKKNICIWSGSFRFFFSSFVDDVVAADVLVEYLDTSCEYRASPAFYDNMPHTLSSITHTNTNAKSEWEYLQQQ